jgi:hypothetical protein
LKAILKSWIQKELYTDYKEDLRLGFAVADYPQTNHFAMADTEITSNTILLHSIYLQ